MILSQNTIELIFPEAFQALPEAYQNDSCLTFEWRDNVLTTRPTSEQVFALGSWTAFYCFDSEEWLDDDNYDESGKHLDSVVAEEALYYFG